MRSTDSSRRYRLTNDPVMRTVSAYFLLRIDAASDMCLHHNQFVSLLISAYHQETVPRTELAALEARFRALETSTIKDTERHQAAVDVLNQRLRTAMQENESLQTAMQARRAKDRLSALQRLR